jgi:hypothetical protein
MYRFGLHDEDLDNFSRRAIRTRRFNDAQRTRVEMYINRVTIYCNSPTLRTELDDFDNDKDDSYSMRIIIESAVPKHAVERIVDFLENAADSKGLFYLSLESARWEEDDEIKSSIEKHNSTLYHQVSSKTMGVLDSGMLSMGDAFKRMVGGVGKNTSIEYFDIMDNGMVLFTNRDVGNSVVRMMGENKKIKSFHLLRNTMHRKVMEKLGLVIGRNKVVVDFEMCSDFDADKNLFPNIDSCRDVVPAATQMMLVRDARLESLKIRGGVLHTDNIKLFLESLNNNTTLLRLLVDKSKNIEHCPMVLDGESFDECLCKSLVNLIQVNHTLEWIDLPYAADQEAQLSVAQRRAYRLRVFQACLKSPVLKSRRITFGSWEHDWDDDLVIARAIGVYEEDQGHSVEYTNDRIFDEITKLHWVRGAEAVGMGLHARLGQGSLLKHLNNDTLRIVLRNLEELGLE